MHPRWVWFLGLWLLAPWPLGILGDSLVPAVRYAILTAAGASVAFAEGASGPVGGIIALFAAMTAATTLGCGLAAWVVSRALAPLPQSYQRAISWYAFGAGVGLALLFEPYCTPMGRAATGGLLEVLS
jgi:hypothetical protein